MHLGNEFAPNFFVSKYIVPYLKSILCKTLDFEKVFIPHLRTEINRLQKKKINDKSKKVTAIDTDAKNAKCENKGCQWINVTLKNVDAYGLCASCQGYEHHHCAGTSKMMKEEIKLGRAIFICTSCMESNPALIKELATTKTAVSAMDEIEEVNSEENGADEVQNFQTTAIVHEIQPADVVIQDNSLRHIEVMDKSCEKCDFNCTTDQELTKHMVEHDTVQICPPQVCEVCEETFTDNNELVQHVRSHADNEYSCEICEYKTGDRELLNTHVTFQHVNPARKFECSTCKNTFNTEQELEEHIKLHERAESVENFKCDFCNHKALTVDDLEKHVHDEHDAPKQSEEDMVMNKSVGEQEMSRKLRMIEDSYDRLMTLFKRKQSEHSDKELAFKIELEEVNEKLRVIKTENQKLKEINETQHKLWKIFVEKVEKDKNESTEKINNVKTTMRKVTETASKETEEPIEIMEDDEVVEEIQTEEAYQEWLKDIRGRGFKR